MGALRRPDLPAGPHRDLVDALHDLHHRAGWPSLRTMAHRAGCSHTTISKVFSAPDLPSWGTLELLVEALDGDAHSFHVLWLGASAPHHPIASRTRIAGRVAELAVVRRHLEAGRGLLLLTGEAGIGKTRLLGAATGSADLVVTTGHCLPLATELPLLPFADALRTALRHDDRQWFKEALAECPPYVAEALSPLLPELAPDGARDPGDSFARHRMFTGTAAVLTALASSRPFALVLEDLHWADLPSLDLLEHLVADGLAMPVIGTWRTGDPATEADHDDWSARLRRHPGVTSLELAQLTREETAEQLLLATGTPATAAHLDRVQALGQGLPLYTEHLAAAPDGQVPQHLGDLLDLRLGQLGDEQWQVARVLGTAERSLPVDLLRSVSGLSADAHDHALAALARRRLVLTGVTDHVTLAHPLLAEAIRRRLLPGESRVVHARLAGSLADQPGVEPGEVAHHWQEAGQPGDELGWRVAAARWAGQRFAAREGLDNWLRVVHLCRLTEERPGLEHWEILCEAMVAASAVPDLDTAVVLTEKALALDLDDNARVRVLRLAGDIICFGGDHERGLRLLDEAGRLLENLPDSPELVDVLLTRIGNLSMVGRYDEVPSDLRRALELVTTFDDSPRRRRVLNWAAWHAMAAGDHDRAAALAREAREVRLDEPDPLSDLALATNATDILLFGAAPAATVEAAATPALEHAAEWDLEGDRLAIGLRANVAEAHLRAGDTRRASEVLGLDSGEVPPHHDPYSHLTLAAIEMRRGEVDVALCRCLAAEEEFHSRGANWAESVGHHVEVALWAGRHAHAVALLDQALDLTLPTDNARAAAPNLALLARVRADVLDQRRADPDQRRLVAEALRARHRSSGIDPFGPDALGVMVPTWAQQWHAELARVERRDEVFGWIPCAVSWDALGRPHDSAYCRWRAAQAALRAGQGSLAGRLLKRAATDAREHVPLVDAIAATRAGAR